MSRGLTTIVLGVGLLFLMVTPAAATTFCVPGFHASCPNSGGNVAQASLKVAMQSNASDGVPDRILIGAHTYTDPGTLTPSGTDHLEVIGSGTGSTFITSSLVGGNNFVVNLDGASRITDMKDLTIIIPASFADNAGAGLQAADGTFDHVNIESRNPRSDGAPSLVGNTVWTDSHIYGAQGGSIAFGIAPNGVGSAADLEIVRTVIDDALWGVVASDPDATTHLRQSRISKPTAYGLFIEGGGQVFVQNSVFETGGQEAIYVESGNLAGDTDIDLLVKNSTFVAGADPAKPAFRVEVGAGNGSHDIDVAVSESILRGFDDTWQMITPAGPGIGSASLAFTDSNFVPEGLPDGSPSVDFSDPGNINLDPLFVGPTDYHLRAGSPSIDAGDPGVGTLVDFDGGLRPQDGNGDGSFIRDMGAFEAATVPTCENNPALCPGPPDPPADTTAPLISKVKFKAATKKKAGSLRLELSEAATIKAVFKPVPAKKKGHKIRKSLKLSKQGKAGANRLMVKKRKLKRGRYRLSITATDAAGNKSKPVVKRIKIKR